MLTIKPSILSKKSIEMILKHVGTTPFRRDVYLALYDVQIGETISYKDLAIKAGYKGASRAVGTAMAQNPFPYLIPCHRVKKSNGDIGNYLFGSEMKSNLINDERQMMLTQTK